MWFVLEAVKVRLIQTVSPSVSVCYECRKKVCCASSDIAFENLKLTRSLWTSHYDDLS